MTEKQTLLDSLLPPPFQVRILIVDDEPSYRQALSDLLGGEGYQTFTASNGEDAMDLVATQNPDLILLDVQMPGLSGFEVCERIKGNPKTLFIPVVLVTGLRSVEDRVKGAQAGADEFLSKPVDVGELSTRVRSLLRVKFLHSALETSNQRLQGLLEDRTRQLERAQQELQQLLEEKAHFTLKLTPPALGEPVKDAQTADGQVDIRGARNLLLGQLSAALEGRTDLTRTPELVESLSQRLTAIYQAAGLTLPPAERGQLFREVVDEILGYGPIEPLLADPTVSEVMVNGPQQVYAEREGQLIKTDVRFDDDDHVQRIIERIIRPLGRRVDPRSPMVDARLPDGSRVNAIIQPCAIDGPTVTIRKFSKEKLTVEDLIGFGSLDEKMANFLQMCVQARLNILVSGGTGSGKTTLLNVLSSFIPESERIVTIEDSAELQLHQDHVVRTETKPPDTDGEGEINIRALVRNSLRMRPDRIIVGEVRGGEALDMLQAMNTGHDGSLTTVHANSPRDTLARLETLVLMAGMELPLKVVRAQIASAINLIVQQARLRDGSRKVTHITEVQGMEGDHIVLSDIFVFKEKGVEGDRVLGAMESTGIRPRFSEQLATAGFHLPAEMFVPPRDPPAPNRRGRKSR